MMVLENFAPVKMAPFVMALRKFAPLRSAEVRMA